MAKNTGDDYRRGEVKVRSQVLNPVTNKLGEAERRDRTFIDVKEDGKPFKGVRREHPDKACR
jgi:hypothetical protein